MRPPNVLFVFADQWRRQAAGCMHADPVATPRIDAFAAEGLTLDRAFCASPICTPSRASILAGRYPHRLGMMHNWLQFPADEPTIAPTFRAAGYHTGYVGKWHLDAFLEGDGENAWNIYTPPGERRLGFQHWYAHGCNHAHFTRKYMRTDGTIVTGDGWQIPHEVDEAIAYLENADGRRDPEAPFCLFLSWSPPHTTNRRAGQPESRSGYYFGGPEEDERPYLDPALPMRGNAWEPFYREAAPGYFGAVTSMDREFGRLLDALDRLGLRDDTIVVLTADHGEMLGSQGQMTKDVWFEESIGIPFFVRWPGNIPAGTRSEALFSTIDIFPTLAGLAGVPAPAGRDGHDFAGHFRGGVADGPNQVFLAHNCGSPYEHPVRFEYPVEPGRYWRAIRTTQLLYVATEAGPASQYHDPARFHRPLPGSVHEVLYDLAADPLQLHPIYPGQGADALFEESRRALRGWLAAVADPFWEERCAPFLDQDGRRIPA